MNRRLTALALIAVVPFGLAACSGPDAPTTTGTPSSSASASPTPTSASSPAPTSGTGTPDAGASGAAPGAGGQSTAEACSLMTSAITSAGQEFSSIDMSNVASNPGAAVDAYLKMAKTLSDATAKVTNEQVRAAAVAVSQSFTALTDGLSKAFSEKDPATLAEFPALQAAATDSMSAFTKICQG